MMSEAAGPITVVVTQASTPESVPPGQQHRAQSNARTDSTVFSLSQTEPLWTSRAPQRAWLFYRHAILLMSTGGTVFLVGVVLSGLYFAYPPKHSKYSKATGIMGPILLSIGLMVLMVGVVLIPVTRETKQINTMMRIATLLKPQQINL